MAEIIKAGIGLVLEFVVFFCLGNLLMRKLKMREEASLSLVLGYILYFSLFEIAAVPMVLSWAPLHVLSAVWAVLLTAPNYSTGTALSHPKPMASIGFCILITGWYSMCIWVCMVPGRSVGSSIPRLGHRARSGNRKTIRMAP